jgi:tetratricopeptide (TPR) repeat protein
MVGDILSEMGQPDQALAEYEAELKLNPNRFDSLYGAGRAAEMLKLPEKAAAYFDQLVKICAGTDSNRPELTYARGFLSKVAKRN